MRKSYEDSLINDPEIEIPASSYPNQPAPGSPNIAFSDEVDTNEGLQLEASDKLSLTTHIEKVD
jgi:hypothetical protein